MPIHPEAVHWLTLALLPGLGSTLIHRLVDHCGAASAVLRRRGRFDQLPRGIGPRIQALLADEPRLASARRQAQEVLARLEQLGGALLCPESPEFPHTLLTIPDPPAVLHCRGDISLLSLPAVALIGSRAATEYGRRVAYRLATELATQVLVVVSGAAYGIDAAAHRGALDAGGKTIAVLGCGLDVPYPKNHAPLLAEIAAHGLILSEYPLGTKPESFRFPARNRLISGLARGVVVVEATEKSGSLITAGLALDQGREVFAVPGRIDSPKSAGAHWLIRQGAHLVRQVDDILEALAWGHDTRFPVSGDCSIRKSGALTDPEQLVWEILEVYPQDIDSLVGRSELSVVDLQGLLLQLELKGLVRQLPGQLYERIEGD
ncbi:MAG: DNA-processing protein DprA [Desulfobulbus sp.]|nr:DNA-processing protein DprA [Desulfobulbus sp.]